MNHDPWHQSHGNNGIEDSVLADQTPVDDDDPDDPKERRNFFAFFPFFLPLSARPLDTERRKQDSYKMLAEEKVTEFICASEESFCPQFVK